MRIMKWFFLIYCFLALIAALIAVIDKFFGVPQSAEFFGASPKSQTETTSQDRGTTEGCRQDRQGRQLHKGLYQTADSF